MANLNKIMVIGNVGKPPEIRFVPSNTKNRNKMGKIELPNVIEIYLKCGTLEKTAIFFNCSIETVRQRLKELGHVILRKGGHVKFKQDEQELRHLYFEENLSQAEIALKLGLSRPTIIKYFKRFAIKARTTTEANRLSWNSGKHKIGSMPGEKNPSWKGGRILNKGYVLIKKPEHPRAGKNGYVAEHILVWEQAHGCPLPREFEIHHLNSIRADNRAENLLAVTSKGHPKLVLLKMARKRIRELEAKLKAIQIQQKFNIGV
jgi:predicted DNA-binding protein (UPF0251 family)